MSVRIGLRFAISDKGIEAISFARMLIELQRLSLIVVTLGQLEQHHPVADQLLRESPIFDPALQTYSAFIVTRGTFFGPGEVHIVRIQQQSPMLIEFFLKVSKELSGACVKAWRFIFERVLFGDVEKEKRWVNVGIARQELLKKRLENLAAAYDLSAKIEDPRLRERFLAKLEGTLMPFGLEYPEITETTVREEKDSDS
jgi:hypothetical protein